FYFIEWRGNPRTPSGKIIIAKSPSSHYIPWTSGRIEMHRLIADKQEEIAAICRRHRVERLEVFGSAARATDFDPLRSDIDFLVEFNSEKKPVTLERYLGIIDDLSSAMAREVDLVEEKWIRNPYLKEVINEEREVVFEE
ncbi:MAG: nucleotidyltransferase domain-containing protein, partial [Rhodobacteraceae bacterium]|nr:nucleotidyltransferase domain-containing protein [Paracoccaceae bacterium]